jgi:prevent-host-death family protein
MIVANIHQAKTNLSKLIEQAEAGQEVVIARNGKPAVRLTPVVAPVSVDEPRRPDGLPGWMGSLKGQIWMAPDFDAYDEEIARSFEESEIFPKDDPEA